ncbi:Hypothetical predicted protein [Marmota monax]|uniref:Fibronectin type-III domain-containing protein n=1 Tax=Marmota monax TaxID=9995 RepID=A0A5E4CEQ9_MARMO|nr:Hypothetical predicted protein [Marmota monax]
MRRGGVSSLAVSGPESHFRLVTEFLKTTSSEMVITDLQPETAYSITVAAYTMKGDGARSKPKVVVTKGAVLGRPTLSVQQTPEGSLLARWEPPAAAEDQVLGYRLQFGRQDAPPLATLEFAPSEDRYTAAGVHKGATYVFRLAARSRGGLGEEAAEVLSIPEDAPHGHPQILEAAGNASAGTVLLRWLPPVPAERNGAIVKYTVAVREAGALGPARETELPAAAEPGAENVLTLRGLKPDTAYDLQVRAHTRRGPGPYSPPVRYRTFLRDQGRRSAPHRAGLGLAPPPPPPPQVSGHFSASSWTSRRVGPRLAKAKVGSPLAPPPHLLSAAASPQQGLGQGRQGQARARQEGRGHRHSHDREPGPPRCPAQALTCLSSALSLLPGAVSPKNFKVKMITKTSVLLSWEFPDNYNSPTPYKVRRWLPGGAQGAQPGIRAQSGLGPRGGLSLGSGLSQHWDLEGGSVGTGTPRGARPAIQAQSGLGPRGGLSLGSGLSQDWDLEGGSAWDPCSVGTGTQRGAQPGIQAQSGLGP